MRSKRILLSLVLAPVAVAPVVTAVSCFDVPKDRYNIVNDKTLTILSSYPLDSMEHKTLQQVLDSYNEKIKGTSDYKVEIEHSIYPVEKTGDILYERYHGRNNELPNFVIGEPDIMGKVAPFQMQNDLSMGQNGVHRSIFSNAFTQINDRIDGIRYGGNYIVPLAKTIDVFTANLPLINWLINAMISKGAEIDPESKIVKGILDPTLEASFIDDQRYITSLWGYINEISIEGYVISDAILTNMSDLLDFAIHARSLFPIQSDIFVFGIDSISNVFYTMIESMATMSNAHLYTQDSKGNVRFNFMIPGTDAYKNFKIVYDKLAQAIQSKAVYIKDVDDWNSAHYQKYHKTAFSLSSSQEYDQNYISSNLGMKYYGIGNTKELISYARVSRAISTPGHIKDWLAEITYLDGSMKRIYPYDWRETDEETKPRDDEFKLTLDQQQYLSSWLSTSANNPARNLVFAAEPETAELAQNVVPNRERIVVNAMTPEHPSATLLIVDEVITQDMTLQEDELRIFPTPSMFDGNSTPTIQIQGPSLMSLHTNTQEDEQSRKFANWLLNETNASVGQGSSKVVLGNPAEYFADENNFVIPTRKTLNGSSSDHWNKAQLATFKAMQEMNSGQIVGYENPINAHTGNVKSVIQHEISTTFRKHIYDPSRIDSFEEVFERISKGLAIK